MAEQLILGTRGSPLALAQARMTALQIEVVHGWPAGSVTLKIVKTSGDRIQDRPLASLAARRCGPRSSTRRCSRVKPALRFIR